MTVSSSAISNAYAMFVGLLRQDKSPEAAEAAMRDLMPNDELIQAVVKRYHETAQGIIAARDPNTLSDPNKIIPWYTGSRPADDFWPALERALADAGSLGQVGLESLDRASTKVVASLPAPWRREFRGRGLVLGYVQSGKTSNFTAVISKAADAGYRLFIVLSGIHNNLRCQTQVRLDEQLVGLNPKRWIGLTSDEADFGNPGNADALLAQDQLRVLAVVKKNKTRLTNLCEWLESASKSTRQNCPILIIDDEADQASVNTKGADRAQINKLILRLLNQPKAAYVGYTATPFANIFIDPSVPEDLYPSDFIVDLPRPAAYFGAERLFGRDPLTEEEAEQGTDGLDVVSAVPLDEAADLRPPRKKADRDLWQPKITSTLHEAIAWFVLATATRRARGQGGRHSSMLIHTTQLSSIHFRYRDPIEQEIERLRTATARPMLREVWEKQTARVSARELGELSLTFEEVERELSGVFNDVEVVVDNFQSTDRLDYGGTPKVVIVLGGNTLSRGLTLEGLVVSYFLRTASAYDTLLQMGRWFGYRPGYSDLPRIWMTQDLAEYFQFLATVEAEIRLDISRYEREDLTPREFAVRVRTHPQLAITSALKMKAAEDVAVSYSGRRIQTILFNHRDRDWLADNIRASRRLLGAAERAIARSPREAGSNRYVYDDVPVGAVLDFLGGYRFHQDAQDLVADRIADYIRRQNGFGELERWNIAVVTRGPDHLGRKIDLGGGIPQVGLINRAAMKIVAKPHANIKSLMSHEDRVADLEHLDAPTVRAMSDVELQEARPAGVGLLVLYPIDRDSRPRLRSNSAGTQVRTDLSAVEDVMGVGLVFPEASVKDSAVSYKAVGLPLGDVEEFDDAEELELVDIESMDTESSLNGIEA
ncbi:alpha-1,4 polygalactosaminidase [Blastococcus sp. TF02-09]|uniref:Z1 domain-containing protein n=1 Tax=Blastococcus sp. TF02-09 TaxID=2250576 RepID=UPI000DE921BA|nr:Z1 domain-containing protein [Blastococcus sp. TF02-9]RBY76274.1 alpha-1,4 polygalactosaminidase [Blastococcus sp. TF02-9]